MSADELPRVRPGTDRDVEQIAHIHRSSRAWYYGTEADAGDGREAMWLHMLAQPGRSMHVAEESDRMVGFISAMRAEDLEAKLELTALYVLPECGGLGIGPRLYEQFDAERRDEDEDVRRTRPPVDSPPTTRSLMPRRVKREHVRGALHTGTWTRTDAT